MTIFLLFSIIKRAEEEKMKRKIKSCYQEKIPKLWKKIYIKWDLAII